MCVIHRTICYCCKLFYINHPNNYYSKKLNRLCDEPCKEDVCIKLCFDYRLCCDYCINKCKEIKKHDSFYMKHRVFYENSITRFNYEIVNNPIKNHYLKLICRRYFSSVEEKNIAQEWQKKMILWKFKR